MMWLSIGYLIRNLVRGAIHPTSEEAGILYPLTPFFINKHYIPNMKVIDYDVSKRIPPINESDIYNKIIISHKVPESSNIFIDFIIIDDDGMFKFRGSLYFRETRKWQNPVIWWDNYNSGKTMMDLLIKEQIEMESRNWTTIHYVIESHDDLNIIINTCGIDGSFRNELLNVWNNLPGNQKA